MAAGGAEDCMRGVVMFVGGILSYISGESLKKLKYFFELILRKGFVNIKEMLCDYKKGMRIFSTASVLRCNFIKSQLKSQVF